EFHRATPWLVEAHVAAAEAVARLARSHLTTVLPCAVSDNTTNPTSQNDGASNAERDVACAEEFLERYGHRAFRRPMREAERQIFRELFADTYRTKGLEEGIVTLVQAMLQ